LGTLDLARFGGCGSRGDMYVVERMGLVFNMAYGIQGESRYTHLPAMFEMLGIPYVGSGPDGHSLALDKVITKIIMQKHGIPTPNFGSVLTFVT